MIIVRASPTALAKLFVSPEIAQQFEAWGRCVIIFVGGRSDDAHHVVAKRLCGDAEQTAVDAGRAGDLSLLAPVNISLRRGEPIRGARLDFYETEHRTFITDQINLGVNERPAQVSPDGQLEVGRDHAIADAFKPLRRQSLAAPAEREMRRDPHTFPASDDDYCLIFKQHALYLAGRFRILSITICKGSGDTRT